MIFLDFDGLGLHMLIFLDLRCKFFDLGLELDYGRALGHQVASLVWGLEHLKCLKHLIILIQNWLIKMWDGGGLIIIILENLIN